MALIERAVNSNTGGMGYLRNYRSPADLADIAAFLGNTPSALNFPVTPVGSSSTVQAVTVRTSTKVGAGALKVHIEGDFTVRASTCATELPRFSECTVDVAFRPTAGGPRSGALLISHDGTPTPVRIALEGLATERPPAIATALPAQLDFGTRSVGLPGPVRNLMLANNSPETLTVTDVRAGNGPFVIAGGSCTRDTTLSSGQHCTVSLRFDPTNAGPSNGTLTIVHDGVGGRSTVALAGSGLAGAVTRLRASPEAVAFGVTEVGRPPTRETITLINEGNAPLTMAELASTGSEFTIERNGCAAALPLAPREACQLQVAFSPLRAGNFSAELRVAGAGLVDTLRVPLYGRAALDQPLLQASPSRLPFAETVGRDSVQQLMIVNRGSVATRVSSLELTGPDAAEFAIAPGTTCQPGSTLAPGTGCTVALRFAPMSPGQRLTRVKVLAEGIGTPAAFAELAGHAHERPAPWLSLDAVALAFTEREVGTAAVGAPQHVTVYNAGRAALRWSSMQVVGDHAADFTVGGDCDVGLALAPGTTCALQLDFAPRAAGLRSASLRLATADSAAVALVTLAGRGVIVAAGQLRVDTPAVDFGRRPRDVAAASRRVVLSNSGGAPLAITALRTDGPFALSPLGAGCQRRLLPGESCVVELLFDTDQAGPAVGRLVIESPAAPPHTVVLTGESVASGPWLDWQLPPTTPTHASTALGRVTAGAAWTVVNRGDAATPPLHWRAGGAAAADFSLDPNSTCTSGKVLPAGSSCFVRVMFHPVAGGPRVAELQLHAGDAMLTRGLAGRALAPAAGMLVAAPVAAVFQAGPGLSPKPLTVLWHNEGAAAVQVQPIALRDASFTLGSTANDACPAETFDLLPGQSCQVEVGWTGAATGASSTQLLATSDDAWGGTTVPVSVSEDPAARSNVGTGGGVAGSAFWLLALAVAAFALRREAGARLTTESRHV